MIDKFSQISRHISRDRRSSTGGERGFILPIAISIGLITSLLGVVMLVRSHNDENNAAMREAIARSEAVAELAVSRYMNLIDSNREIATLNACQAWSTDTCSDATGVGSWKNTAVSAQATRNWQNVSDDSWEDGQYRLWDYSFDDTADEGTLIVEGRVNQGAAGTEGAGTTYRRLRVTFPVSSGDDAPHVWITCNREGGSGSYIDATAVIESDIRDSTPTSLPSPLPPEPLCDEESSDTMVSRLRDVQPIRTPPYEYQGPNHEARFPPLP